MGLFSRNEPPAGTGRRSAARNGVSSDAQAAELRVRARRRLIGALVLVLTAIIFVPLLFDSPPEEELPSPVVLPEPIPAVPSEPQVALAPEPVSPPAEGAIMASPQTPESPVAGQSDTLADAGTQPPAPQSPEPKPEPAKPEPPPKPEPPAESPKPASKPAASQNSGRTDDGSVALALLEGRQPPKPAPSSPSQASGGSFVLQVAAYTTQADAQSRREKLAAAGVTNAYVENAVANGKTAYRLRVGPFPTREAAEAAQARLRQLGYNNGLIFNK